MIQIRKLTPPQIDALRAAFPNMVKAGWLTFTNSIATLHPVPGKKPWMRHNVANLLSHKVYGNIAYDDRLKKVLEKVENRPEMVRELAA